MEKSVLKELLRNYLRGTDKEIPVDFSNITDIAELISYWQKTSSGSEPRKLIEARMVELVKEVSLDTIPEWFEKTLQGEIFIPSFLKEDIKTKAAELLQACGAP